MTTLISLFIICGIQLWVFSDKMLIVNYISNSWVSTSDLFIGENYLAKDHAFDGYLVFIYNEMILPSNPWWFTLLHRTIKQ